MKFCGQCGFPFSQGPNEATLVTAAKPPSSASSTGGSQRSPSGGPSSARNGAFFGVVGLLAACLLFICAGAGLVGAQQFGVFGGSSTPTAIAQVIATPTPIAGGPTPGATPGQPPGGATPTPEPPQPTPEPALKPQYEKGEGATMGGTTLTLTDFKADIGSILNQRARLDTTFTFKNDSGAPVQLNLPGQAFTVLVLEDRFDASTVNPGSGTVNPGETATIAVSFTVTGGLQKFINVKEIFVVANQVGPVAGPKWRLPFGR
jgi:hypothetical protein